MDNRVSLYPTTLLHRRLPGAEPLNAELAAFIKGIETTEANAVAGSSNEGGFQTDTHFLKREHPALDVLKQHLRAAVRDYAAILVDQECSAKPRRLEFTIWGWAVVLRAGNTQGVHVHPYANISGVYYIAAPPAVLEPGSGGGKICFYDPRPRANMNQMPGQITFRNEAPVPGDMILFPSWLEHSVPAFRGEGERICIAFNASLVMS